MTRYRKKPVVVDAKQWTGDNLDEIAEFVGPIDPPLMDEEDRGIVWIWVNEHAERQAVLAGDWVVADPDGIGYHQCSAIEFGATFEVVAGTDVRVEAAMHAAYILNGEGVDRRMAETMLLAADAAS